MPAPKKPRPPVEFDAAAIDDGWSLPTEFDAPKPSASARASTEQRADAVESKPAPRPRKRLEDWFDEVDLGWVLPEDERPLGPPAPEEVAADAGDVESAYEELELSAEPERIDAEPEPIDAEPEPVVADTAVPPVAATGDGRIDLNEATLDQLVALPGIGPKKAHAILAWREENQRFDSVADLAQVSGFGAKSVAKLAEHLVVREQGAS